MNILFLGTSSSEVLPRAGCNCPQCKSRDRRDKRMRSSILINQEILVDAGPDALEQIKSQKVKVKSLQSAIITHKHEDHVKGLKKLKVKNEKLKIYYPKDGQRFKTEGIEFFAFEVPHSKVVKTHALAISDKRKATRRVVYAPDFSKITPKMKKIIKRSKIAILDGSMLNRPFGGHLPITKIIKAIGDWRLAISVYFTHNGHTRMPHKELEKIIQKTGGTNFHLAYDGMKLGIRN